MLLQTHDELGRYVANNYGDPLPDALSTELRRLERDELRQLLGRPVLSWLQQAYDAQPDLDADESAEVELLGLVQAPLAYLGVAGALDELQLQVDDTGVHIISTDTSKTAFQWQVKAYGRRLITRADLALDTLVQWLEDNYQGIPQLEAWAASEAGQRHRRWLFTSTQELQDVVNISGSRSVLVAMRPALQRVTDFLLRPVLGEAFLQELLDQVRERTLTSENRNLLRSYVQPALGHWALADAIPELGLRLKGDGVELVIARFDDSNEKEADAGLDALLQQRVHDAAYYGHRYLQQLREFLNRTASATRFATYFNSPAYTPAAAPVPPRTDRKIYRFGSASR